jgi:hypothetical protein
VCGAFVLHEDLPGFFIIAISLRPAVARCFDEAGNGTTLVEVEQRHVPHPSRRSV